MMPPDAQPVSVVSWHLSQQQSKQRCVSTAGHSNLQHSSQQKQGCSFGQQRHKWPSLWWQQSSQPQLLHELQPQPLSAAQVGAAALQPGAAALQLAAEAGAGAGAAFGAG